MITDDTLPLKIFIVEDHEVTRLGLRLALSAMPGLGVVGEAASGQEAVDKVMAVEPNVVLMDIGIPHIDGIEATRIIKQKCPDVKVVMVTSHDGEDELFAAFAAGADAYCLKEATSEQLNLAIQSVASGATWLHPGIAAKIIRASSAAFERPKATTSAMFLRSFPALKLSEREFEVLQLLVEGLSNQEMADRLCLSPETIKTHMRHLMEKLSVSDRTQAAIKAIRQGLV